VSGRHSGASGAGVARPPQALYEEPESLFVADFLGSSNLITAEAEGRDGSACRLRVGEYTLQAAAGDLDASGPVKAVIRPERLEPHGAAGDNCLPGMVEHVVFLGGSREARVRMLGGDLIKAVAQNDGAPVTFEQGTPVTVRLPAEALRVLRDGPVAAADDEAEAVPAGAGNGAGDGQAPVSAT
jgi:ABC-type Fe3+/spermidine/putrescine transport system ATPase subunit